MTLSPTETTVTVVDGAASAPEGQLVINGSRVTDNSDANAQYFRRQLVQFEEDEETLFSPNITASVMPVDRTGGWKKEFTYGVKSYHGEAVIAECCDDIPLVGMTRCNQSSYALTIQASAKWCWTDIEYARAAGENLEADFAIAAQKAIDEKLEQLIWEGYTNLGVTGILNNPGINVINFGGMGSFTESIYVKLARIYNTIVKSINGVGRRPDTWAVPPSVMALLQTSFVGRDDVSLLSRIQAQFSLRIIEIPYLEYAGPKRTPISLMFVNDRSYMRVRIPKDVTRLPQVTLCNNHYQVSWYLRYAGVRTTYTQSAVIITGLTGQNGCLEAPTNCIGSYVCD